MPQHPPISDHDSHSAPSTLASLPPSSKRLLTQTNLVYQRAGLAAKKLTIPTSRTLGSRIFCDSPSGDLGSGTGVCPLYTTLTEPLRPLIVTSKEAPPPPAVLRVWCWQCEQDHF